jgi:hypothetical protein
MPKTVARDQQLDSKSCRTPYTSAGTLFAMAHCGANCPALLTKECK